MNVLLQNKSKNIDLIILGVILGLLGILSTYKVIDPIFIIKTSLILLIMNAYAFNINVFSNFKINVCLNVIFFYLFRNLFANLNDLETENIFLNLIVQLSCSLIAIYYLIVSINFLEVNYIDVFNFKFKFKQNMIYKILFVCFSFFNYIIFFIIISDILLYANDFSHIKSLFFNLLFFPKIIMDKDISYLLNIFWVVFIEEILFRVIFFTLIQRKFCTEGKFNFKAMFLLNIFWVGLHFNIFFLPFGEAIAFLIHLLIFGSTFYYLMIKSKNIFLLTILHIINNIFILFL